METVIVEVSRPHRILERGRGGRLDRIPIATGWELVEAPGGRGCELTLSFLTEPSTGLDRARERLGAERFYRRQWSIALSRLKELVESGAAPERVGDGGRRPAAGDVDLVPPKPPRGRGKRQPVRSRALELPRSEATMRAFLTLAAIAAVGLVAVAPAGAKTKQESFTFGDANVIGPVHVRGDVCEGPCAVLVRCRRPHLGVGEAERSGGYRPVGFGGGLGIRWRGQCLVAEPSRLVHLRWQAACGVVHGRRGRTGQPRTAEEGLGLGPVLYHQRRRPECDSHGVVEGREEPLAGRTQGQVKPVALVAARIDGDHGAERREADSP